MSSYFCRCLTSSACKVAVTISISCGAAVSAHISWRQILTLSYNLLVLACHHLPKCEKSCTLNATNDNDKVIMMNTEPKRDLDFYFISFRKTARRSIGMRRTAHEWLLEVFFFDILFCNFWHLSDAFHVREEIAGNGNVASDMTKSRKSTSRLFDSDETLTIRNYEYWFCITFDESMKGRIASIN